MSSLQAITTDYGLEALSGALKETVTQYQLIGALTPSAESDTLYDFHSGEIETSYFDEEGVLSFVLNLPIDTHFDEYLHQIYIMDADGQNVITCETPKVALAKGVGGMVTLKSDITGVAGEVVFKHSEYITEPELFEVHLPPLLNEKEDKNNAATDDDIDSVSEESKHIKLSQLWRALSNWFKAHKEEENPHEQYEQNDNAATNEDIDAQSTEEKHIKLPQLFRALGSYLRNDGKVTLTTNDGAGNANVTFNHKNGAAQQDGSSARIAATTDSTTANLSFQVADSASEGKAVSASTIIELLSDRVNITKPINHNSGLLVKQLTVNADTNRTITLRRSGNVVTAKGYWSLTGNLNNGAFIGTIPSGYRPIDTFEAPVHVPGSKHMSLYIANGGGITVFGTSNAVSGNVFTFQLTWITNNALPI